MMLKILLSACSLSMLLSAWQNASLTDIRILTPSANQEFKTGDTIWIKADISSDGPLHDVGVLVTSTDDKSILFSKNIHTHGNKAVVREFFINPLPVKKNLQLSIETRGHDGQISASQSVLFSSKGMKKKSR